MIITVLTVILLVAATSLTFFSGIYAPVVAFLGLCCAGMLPGEHFSVTVYVFWGLAMLIAVALGLMLPPSVTRSRIGMSYICGASFAGMLVGLALSSHAAVVAGAFAGAALGGVAFAKTPSGKVLEFPTSKFLNYLCAKGLPAVVTMSIIGTAAGVLMAQ